MSSAQLTAQTFPMGSGSGSSAQYNSNPHSHSPSSTPYYNPNLNTSIPSSSIPANAYVNSFPGVNADGHAMRMDAVVQTAGSWGDSVGTHTAWMCRGLIDASRWDLVLADLSSDTPLLAHLLKSLTPNALALLSLLLTANFIHPLALSSGNDDESWARREWRTLLTALWEVPVVSAALYLNSTFSAPLALRAYTLIHGRPHSHTPSVSSSRSRSLKSTLLASLPRTSMLLSASFPLLILSSLPGSGTGSIRKTVENLMGVVMFCWVDAYYCFEHVWGARGMLFSARTRYVEERWAYFFGFGLPITLLCMWSNPITNTMLFAVLLPFYIIMATHASPPPFSQPLPRLPVFTPTHVLHTLLHPLILSPPITITYQPSNLELSYTFGGGPGGGWRFGSRQGAGYGSVEEYLGENSPEEGVLLGEMGEGNGFDGPGAGVGAGVRGVGYGQGQSLNGVGYVGGGMPGTGESASARPRVRVGGGRKVD